MTVEIIVKCDGRGCSCSREILQDNDREIEHIGWMNDYRTGFHYCPTCREAVEKEIKVEGL